jgi:hypothetical protein
MKVVIWKYGSTSSTYSSSRKVEIARERGYKILEVNDYVVGQALEITGLIPHEKDIKIRKGRNARRSDSEDSSSGNGALDSLRRYLELMVSVEKGKELRANMRKQLAMKTKKVATKVAKIAVMGGTVIAIAPAAGVVAAAAGVKKLYQEAKDWSVRKYENAKEHAQKIIGYKTPPETAALVQQIEKQLAGNGNAAKNVKQDLSFLAVMRTLAMYRIEQMEWHLSLLVHKKKASAELNPTLPPTEAEKEMEVAQRRMEKRANAKNAKLKMREQRWEKMRENILTKPGSIKKDIMKWIGEQDKLKEEARMKRNEVIMRAMARKYMEEGTNNTKIFSSLARKITSIQKHISGALADQEYDELRASGIRLATAQLEGERRGAPTIGRKHAIILNLNNEFVGEAIEKKRPDLLMPYVVRQYVLNLGYREGSTDMIEAERRIMLRVSMEMARHWYRRNLRGY